MEKQQEEGLGLAEKTRVSPPPRYRVVIHNDDETTMDFVMRILESIFGKTPKMAEKITLHIHLQGLGVCGVYSREVAECKVDQVRVMAKGEGFPLQCTMGPD